MFSNTAIRSSPVLRLNDAYFAKFETVSCGGYVLRDPEVGKTAAAA